MKPKLNFREHPFTLKATIYHFFSSFTDALDESFFFALIFVFFVASSPLLVLLPWLSGV